MIDLKHITKAKAPASLEAYKSIEGALFVDMPKNVKDDLRKSLVEEQGGLCCYCGGEIQADYTSVIEHLLPKGDARYKHLQLEYSNLLCSCDGGRAEREKKSKSEKKLYPSHCDNKKHDNKIDVSPLDADCEKQFAYDEEGNIYGLNQHAKATIDILGLDCSTLNSLRKSAIEPYVNMEPDTNWAVEIEFLSNKHDGRYLPFCFAAIYYIKKFKVA